MSGVVEECARGQTPGLHVSVPPPHTTVSPSVCGGVRFTFHLVGDSGLSESESLAHIPDPLCCSSRVLRQECQRGAVCVPSVSDGFVLTDVTDRH